MSDFRAPVKVEYLRRTLTEDESKQDDVKSQLETGENGSEMAEASESEPMKKKPRLRGRNKNRPKLQRSSDYVRLCNSMTFGTNSAELGAPQCMFGEKCKYLHDVQKFWEHRVDRRGNVDSKCPFYTERGRCPFGLMCRFATDHTDPTTLTTLVDETKWTEWLRNHPEKKTEINAGLRNIQRQLQQRRYDFTKSTQFLNNLTIKKDTVEDEPDAEVENGAELDTVAESDPVDKPEEEANGPEGPDEQPSIGPASDEDLIKLRSSERKRIDFKGKRYLAPLTTVLLQSNM